MNSNKRRSKQKPKKLRKFPKISDHFSRKDFICKCGECNSDLKLGLGLVGGLEMLRTKLGKRVNILKGFECQESASKSGKVKRNFHCKGVAADIQVESVDLKEVFEAVQTIEEFTGIGINVDENYVHVDTRKENDPAVWIEHKEDEIPLTDESRKKYLG